MDKSVKTQMEFAVEIKTTCCSNPINDVLKRNNVTIISTDVSKQQLIVETEKTFHEVQDLIESTGTRAALVGQGSIAGNGNIGAAVAMINNDDVKGVVRLVQLDNDLCLIEGTLDGLTPGKHGLKIHEYGDLSDGCKNCGDVFDPLGYKSKFLDGQRHAGNLQNINADNNGRARFRFMNNFVKVWDVIGRSLVVHDVTNKAPADDNSPNNTALGCAIIARSAGLLQNAKRICACDGIPVWDERNVPNAGYERQKAGFDKLNQP